MAGGLGEQRRGRGEVAGRGPGEHRGGEVGHQDAGRPTGPQRGRERGDHLGRVVHHLQQAVTEHQVGAARRDQAGEPVAVALHSGDPVRYAGLGGPSGQRGQRVGAGVHNGHPVAGLGQRHGETAGAAAHVHHLEGAARLPVQFAAQDRPDRGGPRRGVRPEVCQFHPREPTQSRVARVAAPTG